MLPINESGQSPNLVVCVQPGNGPIHYRDTMQGPGPNGCNKSHKVTQRILKPAPTKLETKMRVCVTSPAALPPRGPDPLTYRGRGERWKGLTCRVEPASRGPACEISAELNTAPFQCLSLPGIVSAEWEACYKPMCWDPSHRSLGTEGSNPQCKFDLV